MDMNVKPHGGELKSLIIAPEESEALKQKSQEYQSFTLSLRQVCDLELIINGGFSPLTGFMGEADYQSVLENNKLTSGHVWPVPVCLDFRKAQVEKLSVGDSIALRDGEGFMPAVMEITDMWEPDKLKEAELVYGTTDPEHPGVRTLLEECGDVYVGGRVTGVEMPIHFEFEHLWDTPADLRNMFHKMGWRNVLGFQTSRPVHRMQRDVIVEAAKQLQAHILLHPTVGQTKPGDLSYYARVHCYQAVRKYFPHNLAMLSLLPMAMRMAGPREALLHAIVQQNYGCSHCLIGPNHSSPPSNREEQFYKNYEAQSFVQRYQNELDIEVVNLEEHLYVRSRNRFMPASKIAEAKLEPCTYNERDLKEDLVQGNEIPEWYSFPEVLTELKKVYIPKHKQGFTMFFTGLSGAGKSTLAKMIYAKLIEAGGRPVTLLDGDVVRLNLSSELGFSKEHRNLNVARIGFVASEITKNGGVAICAPIAPYHDTRRKVRGMIEENGAFIEIHVATPLDVCEGRDRKGLYAKARKGIIPEFTGISDPYEVPETPELRIDTSGRTPTEAVQEIYLYLLKEGFLDTSDQYGY